MTPDVDPPDGTSRAMPDNRYVLADNGVDAAGASSSDREGALTLYRARHGPGSCSTRCSSVYSDGWAGRGSAYTYFKPGQRGTLVVDLGAHRLQRRRPAGRAPAIRAGTVKILDPRASARRSARSRCGAARWSRTGRRRRSASRSRSTPVRVELNISPTFHANAYDPRDLGAQVSFKFVPAKQGG